MTKVRLLWSLLLCLLLAHFIAAQTDKNRPESRGSGSVQGMVVNAAGQGVAKAEVRLIEQDTKTEYETLSGSDGGFAFTGIAPGHYLIQVRRGAYLLAQEYSGLAQIGRILYIQDGTHVTDLVVRLLPSSVITGRIGDAEGEAVVGVPVQAFFVHYVLGRRHLVAAANALTDDRGEFRIYGLPAGEYYVAAVHTPEQIREHLSGVNRQGVPDTGDAPTFYPGASEVNKALPIAVCGGEEARAEFMLTPASLVRVFGTVGGLPPGTPAAILLLPQDLDAGALFPLYQSITDSEGNFSIKGVAPGNYMVYALGRDLAHPSGAVAPLQLSNDDADVALDLRPAAKVRGVFVTVDGRKADLSGADVELVPFNENSMFRAKALIRQDGTFELANVGPDRYRIGVYTPTADGPLADYYLKDVTFGGASVLDDGLRLDQSRSNGTLRIVASPFGATVGGIVTTADGEPFSGARIELIPDAAHAGRIDMYASVDTDQNGHFLLRGVAPGDYKVYAFPGKSRATEAGMMFGDEDRVRQHEAQGTPLHLSESQRVTAKLKVISDTSSLQVGTKDCSATQ